MKGIQLIYALRIGQGVSMSSGGGNEGTYCNNNTNYRNLQTITPPTLSFIASLSNKIPFGVCKMYEYNCVSKSL
jgi:hypothetical protein